MKLKNLIIKKLQEMNKPIEQTGDVWFRTTCLNPNHNDTKPSFHINFVTGNGGCWSCGYKVTKEFWTKGIVEDNEEIERELKLKELEYKFLQKEEQKEIKVILPPYSEDVPNNYRGITLWKDVGAYICKKGKYRDRLIMPIYYDKNLKAFETRALFNTPNKYMHSKGFSSKELIYPYNLLKNSNSNYVVLVEGILDALSGWELEIPAITNWGIANNFNMNKIKELLKLGIDTIYLAFDKDQPGVLAQQNMLNDKLLNQYFDIRPGTELQKLKKFYTVPCKDLNELLIKWKGV